MRPLLVVMLAVPAFAQAPAQAVTEAPPATQATAQAPAAADTKTPSPTPSAEDWLTGSVDFGYRWLTDIRGSLATYRSVINLGEGPKLFGLDFTILDPKKRLFDRLDVRASDWGGDPYNTAHLDMRKLGVYDFSVDYRNIIYFNALPSYANPFAPGGFNEQSFDLHRRTADVSLELFPGKHIIPYLMWSRNTGYGNGVETWLTDANNEYAVPDLLRDDTENYRGGVRFEYNRFHITLEQGGTTFKDDDQGFENLANSGDRTTPLLGQSLSLTNLTQAYAIRGDSIYSRGLVTATPFSWLTLTGQFLYSQPTTNIHYFDTANGNLALLNAFYSGVADFAMGNAKQPHVTANGGFEMRPTEKLRIVESLSTDRYHDASFGLFSSFLTTPGQITNPVTTFPGLQTVNYNQEQIDAMYDLTSRVTLRGGYRFIWGDATVTGGVLSQIGSLVSGQLRRNVGVGGASFRPASKLRINVDYEGGFSDDVYFRTSLNDYNRVRARAQYQVSPSLSLTGGFHLLNNQNPAPGVRNDFQSTDESLSFTWTPQGGKRFSFLGEYDRTMLRSDIDYLSLPFFANAVSSYRDNAHTATANISLALPGYGGLTPKLAFGGSFFISSGSRPTQFYEPLAKLSLPLGRHISWNTEWTWYGMGQDFYLYEGFRTHAFTTGIRLTR